MKRLFIIIILLFTIKSYSQSYYKNLFDSMHYDVDLGYSDSGDQQDFSWAASAHMEALVLMYEKTGEKKYAETLIRCMGNVIDRRDDLRGQVPGLDQIFDYRDISGAAWSTNYYNKLGETDPYAYVAHSANITYPMAKFAAIVRNDPAVQNLVSDSLVAGRYAGQNYIAIADDLIQKIKETLLYHDDQWHTEPGDIGYYKERNDNPPIDSPGIISPFNMQSAIGRVLVQMYRATQEGIYLTQLKQIANFIKANTSLDSSLGSNTWKYWKENDVLPDDASHAGLTISFPYECWKYDVLDNGNPVYTNEDMKAYSKTLTKDIYQSPLFINKGVSHNDESWNIKYDTTVPVVTDEFDGYIAYRWLCLSEFDPEIYQLIADLYAAKNYYDKIPIDNLSFYSSLTIALLANHENLIVPTNTDHEWGESSDWRGVASGNFDEDDEDEFVVIRNYDGLIATMQPEGRKFSPVISSKVYSDAYNWKGIASGDFFGDRKSEIVAVSNHSDPNNNGFYILKIDNNNIVEETQFTGFGAQSDWVGAAAGNFISGGKDDFIAVRNYNKEVLVYQFNGITPQLVHANALNLPANSKIKAVASGNLDSDPKDEVVLLVDAEDAAYNGIYVYDIDDNGVLTKIAESTDWGSASDWKGLAVGDLDADGVDEILVHRNYNGEYIVYKLVGSNLEAVGSESFPALQTKDNLMCFGNFVLGSQNEELITLRKDGGIVMFSAAKIINNVNNNRSSDPCQDELPEQLFSLLKS